MLDVSFPAPSVPRLLAVCTQACPYIVLQRQFAILARTGSDNPQHLAVKVPLHRIVRDKEIPDFALANFGE